MNNNKKHVLILGGSSDIGLEVANLFIKNNWNVTLHFFKNEKKIKSMKKINLIKFNFTEYNSFVEKKIKRKFSGDYDSLINLVGYIDNKSFFNTNLKTIFKSVAANAILPILIEKNLIKRMVLKKWGRIIRGSSIGVKYGGGKNSYNYALSKHLQEFIPSDYKNWAKKNILINNLRIGVTDTKIHRKISNKNMKKRVKLIPLGRMANKKEIAKFIFQLSSEKNTFITGETISIAGGE